MSMLLRRYHDDIKQVEETKSVYELSYDELKAMAKEKGIEDYHKMKKSELVEVLKDSE